MRPGLQDIMSLSARPFVSCVPPVVILRYRLRELYVTDFNQPGVDVSGRSRANIPGDLFGACFFDLVAVSVLQCFSGL